MLTLIGRRCWCFHQQQELSNSVDIQLLVLAIDDYENLNANTNNGVECRIFVQLGT